MRGKEEPVEIRFWRFVEKTDACWLWTGAQSKVGGYGRIGVGHSGVMESAHRVSWELHNGQIPEGMFVCHHCDNPRCVNPEHLFLGTRSDNMKDAYRKGRLTQFPNFQRS